MPIEYRNGDKDRIAAINNQVQSAIQIKENEGKYKDFITAASQYGWSVQDEVQEPILKALFLLRINSDSSDSKIEDEILRYFADLDNVREQAYVNMLEDFIKYKRDFKSKGHLSDQAIDQLFVNLRFLKDFCYHNRMEISNNQFNENSINLEDDEEENAKKDFLEKRKPKEKTSAGFVLSDYWDDADRKSEDTLNILRNAGIKNPEAPGSLRNAFLIFMLSQSFQNDWEDIHQPWKLWNNRVSASSRKEAFLTQLKSNFVSGETVSKRDTVIVHIGVFAHWCKTAASRIFTMEPSPLRTEYAKALLDFSENYLDRSNRRTPGNSFGIDFGKVFIDSYDKGMPQNQNQSFQSDYNLLTAIANGKKLPSDDSIFEDKTLYKEADYLKAIETIKNNNNSQLFLKPMSQINSLADIEKYCGKDTSAVFDEIFDSLARETKPYIDRIGQYDPTKNSFIARFLIGGKSAIDHAQKALSGNKPSEKELIDYAKALVLFHMKNPAKKPEITFLRYTYDPSAKKDKIKNGKTIDIAKIPSAPKQYMESFKLDEFISDEEKSEIGNRFSIFSEDVFGTFMLCYLTGTGDSKTGKPYLDIQDIPSLGKISTQKKREMGKAFYRECLKYNCNSISREESVKGRKWMAGVIKEGISAIKKAKINIPGSGDVQEPKDVYTLYDSPFRFLTYVADGLSGLYHITGTPEFMKEYGAMEYMNDFNLLNIANGLSDELKDILNGKKTGFLEGNRVWFGKVDTGNFSQKIGANGYLKFLANKSGEYKETNVGDREIINETHVQQVQNCIARVNGNAETRQDLYELDFILKYLKKPGNNPLDFDSLTKDDLVKAEDCFDTIFIDLQIEELPIITAKNKNDSKSVSNGFYVRGENGLTGIDEIFESMFEKVVFHDGSKEQYKKAYILSLMAKNNSNLVYVPFVVKKNDIIERVEGDSYAFDISYISPMKEIEQEGPEDAFMELLGGDPKKEEKPGHFINYEKIKDGLNFVNLHPQQLAEADISIQRIPMIAAKVVQYEKYEKAENGKNEVLEECEDVFDHLFSGCVNEDGFDISNFMAYPPVDITAKENQVKSSITGEIKKDDPDYEKKMKIAKAEVLRAMLDPERKVEYKNKSILVNFGDFANTPRRIQREQEYKSDYNKDLKERINNVLAVKNPKLYTFETSCIKDGIFNVHDAKDENLQAVQEAAGLFDDLFKEVIAKHKELANIDLIYRFESDNQNLYHYIYDLLPDAYRTSGYVTAFAKAFVINALANGVQNVSIRPYVFNTQQRGLKPIVSEPIQLKRSISKEEVLADANKPPVEPQQVIIQQQVIIPQQNIGDQNQNENHQLNENQQNNENQQQGDAGDDIQNQQGENPPVFDEQAFANELKKNQDSAEKHNDYNLNEYNLYMNSFQNQEFQDRNLQIPEPMIETYTKRFNPEAYLDFSSDEKMADINTALTFAGVNRGNEYKIISILLVMYALGQKNMTLEQFENLTAEEKKTFGNDFLNDFSQHPVLGNSAGSRENAENNLAWYGKMCSKASDALLDDPNIKFPNFNDVLPPNSVNDFMKNEKFGLAYDFANTFADLTKNWRNNDNHSTKDNPYGVDWGHAFLKEYHLKEQGGNINLSHRKLISHFNSFSELKAIGQSMVQLSNNDPSNPYQNRIKVIKKHLLLDEAEQTFSDQPIGTVVSEGQDYWKRGLLHVGSLTADLNDNVLNKIEDIDEKNAGDILNSVVDGYLYNPDAFSQELRKDVKIFQEAMVEHNRTIHIAEGMPYSLYIYTKIDEINNSDHPELFTLSFNSEENIQNVGENFEGFHLNPEEWEAVNRVFQQVFEPIYSFEEQMGYDFNAEDQNVTKLYRGSFTQKFLIGGKSAKVLAAEISKIGDNAGMEDLKKRETLAKALILHTMAANKNSLEYRPFTIGKDNGIYASEPVLINPCTRELMIEKRELKEALNSAKADIIIKQDKTFDVPAMKLYKLLEADVIRRPPGAGANDDVHPLSGDWPTQTQVSDLFKNAALNHTRDDTVASLFVFYLLSEKDMSIEEAGNFYRGSQNYEEYLRDFFQFLSDNPTVEVSPEKRRMSHKNWARIFANSARKIKDYRIPDIDLSSPEQVAQHSNILYRMTSWLINLSQEYGNISSNDEYEMKKIMQKDYPDFEDDLNATIPQQSFFKVLSKAYFSSPETYMEKANTAGCRYVVRQFSDTFRGKTINELTYGDTDNLKKAHVNNTFTSYMATVMQSNQFSKERLNQYLINQSDQEIEEFIKTHFQKITEEGSQKVQDADIENNLNGFMQALFDRKDFVGKMRSAFSDSGLLSPTKSGKQLMDDLKKPENREILNRILKIFGTFTDGNSYALYKKAGLKITEMIKIDGKTPMELWGEKYREITDPLDRQIAFHVEILREALMGTKSIKKDCLSISEEDNSIVRVPDVHLIRQPAEIYTETRAMLRIAMAHNRHSELNTQLRNTDRNVPAAEKGNLKFGHLFNNVLEKMTDMMDKENNILMSPVNIVNSMKAFKSAAEEYLKAREEVALPINANTFSRQYRNAEEQRVSLLKDEVKNLEKLIPELEKAGSFMLSSLSVNVRKINLDRTRELRNTNSRLLTGAGANNRILSQKYTFLRFSNALNLPDQTELNQQQFNDFESEMNLRIADSFAIKYEEMGNQLLPGEQVQNENPENENPQVEVLEAFGKVGLGTENAVADYQTFFNMWLMSQKGLSVEKLAILLKGKTPDFNGNIIEKELFDQLPEYRDEFIQFCKEHPITGTEFENRETYVQNVKAWTDVFKGATEKMKEYRYPKIDYSDWRIVNNHLPEFMVMSHLTNCLSGTVSEILEKDYPMGPVAEIAESHLGGQEVYNKMRHEWNTIAGVTAALNRGYTAMTDEQLVGPGSAKSGYAYVAVQKAADRCLAGLQMESLGGKTVSDIIDSQGSKGLLLGQAGQKVSAKYAATDYRQKFEYQDAFEYLAGGQKGEFENKIKEEYNLNLLREREAFEKNRMEEASKIPTDVFENEYEDFGDSLRNLSGNARVMKEFLDGETQGKTNKYLVQQKLKNYLKNDGRDALGIAGIKISDLFRMNGKSAEQIWGNKYKDVTDPGEKELFYEAEILKSIVSAGYKITMRKFTVGADGTIAEDPEHSFVVLESGKKLTRMMEHEEKYRIALKELEKELETLHTDFTLTQSNRYANLRREDTDHHEGSEYYREMTLTLTETLRYLKGINKENEEIKVEEVNEKLSRLKEVSDTYYEKRYGYFFRPLRDYGKKRLSGASSLKHVTELFMNRLSGFRSEMNSEMIVDAESGRTLGNCSFKTARKYLEDVSNLTKIEVEENEAGNNYITNLLLQYRDKVEALKVEDNESNRENKLLVVDYLKENFKRLAENLKQDDFADPADLSDIRRYDDLERTRDRLLRNPLFLNMMRNNREKCIENWNRIEKIAEEKRRENLNFLKDIRDRYKSISAYVIIPEHKLKEEDTAVTARDKAIAELTKIDLDQATANQYVHSAIRKSAYLKLTQLVVASLLGADGDIHDRLLQSSAADILAAENNENIKANRTVDKLTKEVYDILIENKLLSAEKARATLTGLPKGDIRKFVLKTLTEEYSNAPVVHGGIAEMQKSEDVLQLDVRNEAQKGKNIPDANNLLEQSNLSEEDELLLPQNNKLNKGGKNTGKIQNEFDELEALQKGDFSMIDLYFPEEKEEKNNRINLKNRIKPKNGLEINLLDNSENGIDDIREENYNSIDNNGNNDEELIENSKGTNKKDSIIQNDESRSNSSRSSRQINGSFESNKINQSKISNNSNQSKISIKSKQSNKSNKISENNSNQSRKGPNMG